eukprot:sb/3461345/
MFLPLLLLLPYTDAAVTPVCYNCHCSRYELDRSISCKTGIFNMTSYFSIWTRVMHVGPGSDVVLAAQLKEDTSDYCWCTDAKLEWNGILQNSSGRLLTTHMTEVTGIESGYFWAMWYWLVLPLLLLLPSTDAAVTPVCYNCHCSRYELDRSISCKTGIFNMTSYFSIWTRVMHVGPGSDVVLAAQLKEDTSDYCWCTDAKLEWNGILQNSSGRLLTTHMTEVTGIESGYFWAVLAIEDKFFFSEEILLNITVPEVDPTLPPLDIDPKMSALIVGILFVVIMFRNRPTRTHYLGHVTGYQPIRDQYSLIRSVPVLVLQHFNPFEAPVLLSDLLTPIRSESKFPLTSWDLQAHSEIIVEEAHVPHPASDLDEEGSVSSEGGVKEKSTSISSQDEGNKVPDVEVGNGAPAMYHLPITDDRFSTDKSWYRSLNTEVVSESLLSDKKQVQKRQDKKKRKKELKNCSKSSLGGYSVSDIQKMEKVYKAYQNLSKDFKYGRSLPTPQPAGARPTVMTVFQSSSKHHPVASGATIHTTHPVVARPTASSLFSDPDTKNSRYNRRCRRGHSSVTAVDFFITLSLNPSKFGSTGRVETDSGVRKTPPTKGSAAVVVPVVSSDSSSTEEKSAGPVIRTPTPSELLPALNLIPATPINTTPTPSSRWSVTVIKELGFPVTNTSPKSYHHRMPLDIDDLSEHWPDPILISFKQENCGQIIGLTADNNLAGISTDGTHSSLGTITKERSENMSDVPYQYHSNIFKKLHFSSLYPLIGPIGGNFKVPDVEVGNGAPAMYHLPITDDRFSTDKSWYRSLNTEVVSESLLSDKKQVQKRQDKKKRKKELKNCSKSSLGGYSVSDIQKMEKVYKAYQNLSKDFKYGRSLPTPQPAGARPTVMTVFQSSSKHHPVASGATIHTTHPVVARPTASSLFSDPDTKNSRVSYKRRYSAPTVPIPSIRFHAAIETVTETMNSDNDKADSRQDEVQFTSAGKHRRTSSVDLPLDKSLSPRKSSLKPSSKFGSSGRVETDSGIRKTPPTKGRATVVVPVVSSDSSSTEEKSAGPLIRTPTAAPSELLPALNLTPATPINTTPTPSSRFTVTRVESDERNLNNNNNTGLASESNVTVASNLPGSVSD